MRTVFRSIFWKNEYRVKDGAVIYGEITIVFNAGKKLTLVNPVRLISTNDKVSLCAETKIDFDELVYHIAELATAQPPQGPYDRSPKAVPPPKVKYVIVNRIITKWKERRKKRKPPKEYRVAKSTELPESEWDGEPDEADANTPVGNSPDPYQVTTGPMRSRAQLARASRPRKEGE